MNKNTVLVLGGFLIGVLLTIFYFNQPKDSAEWASWVQAFGSIGAILAAIWVLRQQNAQAIRRDEDEIDQIILSIRDEVSTILLGFNQNNAARLMENPNGPCLLIAPVSEKAFVIYNTSAFQIGKVKNHVLRAQIVTTYAQAFGFIKSLQLNNELVRNLTQLNVAPISDPARFQAICDIKMKELTEYGPSLRLSFKELEASAEKLIKAIDDSMGS